MIHRMMNGVSEVEIQEHTLQRTISQPFVCTCVCVGFFMCVLLGTLSPNWKEEQ